MAKAVIINLSMLALHYIAFLFDKSECVFVFHLKINHLQDLTMQLDIWDPVEDSMSLDLL